MEQFQVRDKVQHRQLPQRGTVIEIALRSGVGEVYRVDWDILAINEGENFTWHTEEELELVSRRRKE